MTVMATEDIAPGTAFQLESSSVAVRMAPNVTAGKYFVIDPVHGGYYATAGEVADIEASERLTKAGIDAQKVDAGIIDPDNTPVLPVDAK